MSRTSMGAPTATPSEATRQARTVTGPGAARSSMTVMAPGLGAMRYGPLRRPVCAPAEEDSSDAVKAQARAPARTLGATTHRG